MIWNLPTDSIRSSWIELESANPLTSSRLRIKCSIGRCNAVEFEIYLYCYTLIFMFLLVVLLVNSAVCQVTLTALNTSIRAKTTYTFTFQSASLGQTIKITIPSEISTAGTTWVPSATSSSGNTYEWQSVTTFVFNLTNATNPPYVW